MRSWLPRTYSWTAVSQILTSAGNLCFSVILIRNVGVEAFGTFTVFYLSIMISRNYFSALIIAPLSTLYPALAHLRPQEYSAFSLVAATTGSTVISLVSILFVYSYGLFPLSNWPQYYALPLLIATIFSCLCDFLRGHLINSMRNQAASILEGSRLTLQITFLAILILNSQHPVSITSSIMAIAASNVIPFAFGISSIGKISSPKNLMRSHLGGQWSTLKIMAVSTTFETLQSSGPLLIAGQILGDQAIGTIRAAQQISNLLNLPVNALLQILPSIAARTWHHEGKIALFRKLMIIFTWASGMITIGLGILLVATDQFLLEWMAIKNADFSLLLIAFAGVSTMSLVRNLVRAYAYVAKRSAAIMLGSVGGAICALSLTPLTASTLGIVAVAIVDVTSSVVSVTIMSLAIYKRTPYTK